MNSAGSPIQLRVPSASRQTLTFCDSSVDAINEWTNSLPVANTGEVAKALFNAIREINQWDTSSTKRFKALEIIRSSLYSTTRLLSKHFLQSGDSLSDQQLKVANLHHSLLEQLAIGYRMVISRKVQYPRRTDKATHILNVALYRAMTVTAEIIFHACMLHRSVPSRCWLDINQLYVIAEARGLLDTRVDNPHLAFSDKATIKDAFLRIHLLGIARTSSLRQQDIAYLYRATEQWAFLAEINKPDDKSALFTIDLFDDKPARYQNHVKDTSEDRHRRLNTSSLVQALKSRLANPENKDQDIKVPDNVTDVVLNHVVKCWGIQWQRSFRRDKDSDELTICIGMTALHYFCSEQQEFKDVLNALNKKAVKEEPDELFSQQRKKKIDYDVWSGGFDVEYLEDIDDSPLSIQEDELPEIKKMPEPAAVLHDSYKVRLINISPGGYGLHWTGKRPKSLQPGELVGVREEGSSKWAIGLVSWMNHPQAEGVQIGVELLSPNAEPAAARLLNKKGINDQPVRALILPEIPAIAQPVSVLVPRLHFRQGSKVELFHPALSGRFQLTAQMKETHSFCRFQFRKQETHHEQTALAENGVSGDEFDSIWNKL